MSAEDLDAIAGREQADFYYGRPELDERGIDEIERCLNHPTRECVNPAKCRRIKCFYDWTEED